MATTLQKHYCFRSQQTSVIQWVHLDPSLAPNLQGSAQNPIRDTTTNDVLHLSHQGAILPDLRHTSLQRTNREKKLAV